MFYLPPTLPVLADGSPEYLFLTVTGSGDSTVLFVQQDFEAIGMGCGKAIGVRFVTAFGALSYVYVPSQLQLGGITAQPGWYADSGLENAPPWTLARVPWTSLPSIEALSAFRDDSLPPGVAEGCLTLAPEDARDAGLYVKDNGTWVKA
jgi:hypothetical protein